MYAPTAAQVFGPVKLLIAVVAGAAAAASAAVAARRLGIPQVSFVRAPLAGAAVFLMAATVATAASDDPVLSFVGTYPRHSGLAMYVACVLLFLATSIWMGARGANLLVLSIVGVGTVSAFWAFAQRAGVFGLGGETVFGSNIVVTGYGNPNFAAGFLAVAAATAAGAAFERGTSRTARSLFAAAAGAMLVATVLTRSIQGPTAAVLGAAVAGLVVAAGSDRQRRFVPWMVVPGAAALGLIVAGVFEVGPLAALSRAGSGQQRRWMWDAAVGMWREHPILGVGVDRFAAYFRAYQPLESALFHGLGEVADAPHNVPLALLSGGGAVLALAYAAFVGTVVVVVVRSLRRDAGGSVGGLAAMVGGYAAWHAQSLVSFDIPGLAVVHWLLAGALVATARIAQQRTSSTRSSQRTLVVVALGVVTLVAAAAAPAAIAAVRADLAAGRSGAYERGDAGAEALLEAQRATVTAPWEPRYAIRVADLLASNRNLPAAAAALDEALARDSRSFAAALSRARVATGLGDVDAATRYFDRALALDPVAPQLKAEVARFHLGEGDAARAAALLADATAVVPNEAQWLQWLGEAHVALGDEAAARAALERAVAADPANEAAAELLEGL